VSLKDWSACQSLVWPSQCATYYGIGYFQPMDSPWDALKASLKTLNLLSDNFNYFSKTKEEQQHPSSLIYLWKLITCFIIPLNLQPGSQSCEEVDHSSAAQPPGTDGHIWFSSNSWCLSVLREGRGFLINRSAAQESSSNWRRQASCRLRLVSRLRGSQAGNLGGSWTNKGTSRSVRPRFVSNLRVLKGMARNEISDKN